MLRESAFESPPQSSFESDIQSESNKGSNRHILSDADWQSIVFELMEIVPGIIVDATFLNGALAHELKRILGTERLLAKTLVLIPDGPFLEQNAKWRIDVTRLSVCADLGELEERSKQLLRLATRKV